MNQLQKTCEDIWTGGGDSAGETQKALAVLLPSRRAVTHLCRAISKRGVLICNMCSTRASGSYPIRAATSVVEGVGWSVPSIQSSVPGRIRLKPSTEASLITSVMPCTMKPLPAVHAPRVLTNFLKHLPSPYVYYLRNPWRAGPRSWCSKGSRGSLGEFCPYSLFKWSRCCGCRLGKTHSPVLW